jgi:histidine triad (HIT) family protein
MPRAAKQTCPFCDLIHGAGEVSMCFEDAEVVAFMDIQPVNTGHVLVVPREHYESIEDIPSSLASHLFQVSMQLAPVVKQVAGAEGLNLVVNSGVAAGQDVFHYHVHVIPRKSGDGFDIPLPFAGSEMPDRTVLDMNAARIIAALRDPIVARKRAERRAGVTDRRSPSSPT